VTREEIREVVLRHLRAVAPGTDPAAAGPEADLRDALDLDSMDFLRLATRLGGALGIDLPEADFRHLRSLRSCVDYLAARLDARAAGGARG
jgi:acyl carrier protein